MKNLIAQAEATADQMILACKGDIAAGATGWHYVRTCCGVLTAGWWPEPLTLTGVLWAEMADSDDAMTTPWLPLVQVEFAF